MKTKYLVLVLFSLTLFSMSCNETNTGGNVVVDVELNDQADVLPIDRVKLKPSPRAIITWNGQSPKDTVADFWDLGKISAIKNQTDLKVLYTSNDGNITVLLQMPGNSTDIAQLGVFSYRFIDNTQNDQIVIFYSPDNESIKPYVFNVLNHAPYIEAVNFEPPHAQVISPIPYFNFYCESLKVYSDNMYRDCISTFKYSQNHMTLEP